MKFIDFSTKSRKSLPVFTRVGPVVPVLAQWYQVWHSGTRCGTVVPEVYHGGAPVPRRCHHYPITRVHPPHHSVTSRHALLTHGCLSGSRQFARLLYCSTHRVSEHDCFMNPLKSLKITVFTKFPVFYPLIFRPKPVFSVFLCQNRVFCVFYAKTVFTDKPAPVYRSVLPKMSVY